MARGYTEDGGRVLLYVSLGQRVRYEDWLEMGRGLVRRGLPSPWLVVVDGAPGLLRAVKELWPDADRRGVRSITPRSGLCRCPPAWEFSGSHRPRHNPGLLTDASAPKSTGEGGKAWVVIRAGSAWSGRLTMGIGVRVRAGEGWVHEARHRRPVAGVCTCQSLA